MTAVREFKTGDLVRWSSTSRGTQRHHVGVVFLRVEAGIQPADAMAEHPWAGRLMFRAQARTRSAVSYLVALKDGGPGVGRLYWPRTRHLQPYHTGGVVKSIGPLRAAIVRAEQVVAAAELALVQAPDGTPRPSADRNVLIARACGLAVSAVICSLVAIAIGQLLW